MTDNHVGQRSEFTQAGVECIGPEGRGTDAEIIALAIRSMLKIGLKDFQVDIGQVAFFKGLTEGLNLPSKTMEELRTLIDTKNTVELEYRMEELDLSADMRKKLLALPSLFGGRDVIDRAKELCDRAACRDALKHLEQVYDMLCGFGYEKYLSIDLGMLH